MHPALAFQFFPSKLIFFGKNVVFCFCRHYYDPKHWKSFFTGVLKATKEKIFTVRFHMSAYMQMKIWRSACLFSSNHQIDLTKLPMRQNEPTAITSPTCCRHTPVIGKVYADPIYLATCCYQKQRETLLSKCTLLTACCRKRKTIVKPKRWKQNQTRCNVCNVSDFACNITEMGNA